jgi:hypothetical protein
MSEIRICKYCGMELSEGIPHGLRECHLRAVARIAELEARLESCESALASMVYQFFYSSESGALVHSFMSAEEETAEYLVDYGIARWENEHKNSIVFEEVQE